MELYELFWRWLMLTMFLWWLFPAISWACEKMQCGEGISPDEERKIDDGEILN